MSGKGGGVAKGYIMYRPLAAPAEALTLRVCFQLKNRNAPTVSNGGWGKTANYEPGKIAAGGAVLRRSRHETNLLGSALYRYGHSRRRQPVSCWNFRVASFRCPSPNPRRHIKLPPRPFFFFLGTRRLRTLGCPPHLYRTQHETNVV